MCFEIIFVGCVIYIETALCVGHTAAGCSDVEAWPGSLVERFDDRLLVRCNRTHDTWHLMCRNSRWVGNFGNCSDSGETTFVVVVVVILMFFLKIFVCLPQIVHCSSPGAASVYHVTLYSELMQ